MGDDNRHEMMESLFGAESGGSDDEPDNKSSYSNDSNATNSGRDDEEGEGEGGGEVESDMDGAESERAGSDGGRDVESEAERGGVSDRDEVSDREVEEGEPDVESEAERGGASDREEASDREIEEVEGSVSGSETSHRGGAVEYEDHEVDLAREPSEQGDDEVGDEHENEQIDDEQGENEHGDDEQGEDEPVEHEQVEDELGEDEQVEKEQVGEEQDDDEQQASGGVAVARDVFGDSDEDDEEVVRRRSLSREASPLATPERAQSEEERSDQEGELPDEFVGDGGRYDSDDDRQAERKREKPVGPPLDIEVPLKPPPGRADQLNLVRVSNIMGIESKPFDPKTYEEESTFVTDAEGRKQRIRLEENVARWRIARNRDGTTSYESNARFVKWSDGSMQLLLGNEVLDLSVQDSRHDQSHLFIRHKTLLQSQGRLLHKMKFMPSSLTSKSHKLLTALVDSRNKKVLKVKSVVTNIDPDKEKEGQEKAVEQRIRSKSDLQRKQDKISRKYSHIPSSGRDTELSSGYLEGALEEEEEADDYDRGSRRHMDPRRFQQQLDAERGAERRIMNAKRQLPPLKRPAVSKRPAPSRRELMRDVLEDEEEESAYETDPEEEEEEEMDDEDRAFIDEDDEEDPRRSSDKGRVKDRGERRQIDRDDEDKKRRRDPSPDPELSPPRKSTQRRRVVVSESDEED